MEEGIRNRVAESGLMNIDPGVFYPKEKIIGLDLKDFLYEGFILRETEFRTKLKEVEWDSYTDCLVALHCSTDAIVPTWAYMLVSSYLFDIAKETHFCGLSELVDRKMRAAIESMDLSPFEDARILVNGCSEYEIGPEACVHLITQLQKVAKSVMYGEACSSVPVFKRR